MSLTRHKGLARGGPLRPMSAKKLAELGGFALSTFAPKLARTPLVRTGTSGVEESTGRDGSGRGGRPARGHRLPIDVRAVVAERSGGWCEIGIEGCWRTAREMHHRITQKSGGRHRAARARSDRPSNTIHACSRCHLVVTDHPKFAYTNGWSLREGQDSAKEPVLRRGELVYLDDAGGVWSYEEAGA